ncbi:MAG: DNA-processing protein DprA [Eubacteriales bacterium]|nr:DNA-processing protein DprA [Eubacteriales bacterium]
MNQHDQEFYWYWFVNIPSIGNYTRVKLMELYGHPSRIYQCSFQDVEGYMTAKQWEEFDRSRNYRLQEEGLRRLKDSGIVFYHWEQKEYPSRFRNLYDPPYGFYLKGRLPDPQMPAVGIVGSRKASPYGKKMAERYAQELAEAGVSVISGMAAGIDTEAHKGALSVGGSTLGILGGGIDTMYPKSNWNLYLDMYQSAGIMSEYNIGISNLSGLFPMRNRLISALSDSILVVEAGWKSGSLITADQGMEQGKDIFAIPGRITDPMSQGCNHLIAQGAFITESPKDILENLRDRFGIWNQEDSIDNKMETHDWRDTNAMGDGRKDFDGPVGLSSKEKAVYDLLDEIRPVGFEILLQSSLCDFQELQHILMSLELKSYIQQPQQNMYVKKIL